MKTIIAILSISISHAIFGQTPKMRGDNLPVRAPKEVNKTIVGKPTESQTTKGSSKPKRPVHTRTVATKAPQKLNKHEEK